MKSIVKKNIKRLLSSKLTFFVILLGPFLLILLIGLAYDQDSLFSVNVGFTAQTDSADEVSFSRELVRGIEGNGFVVNSYEDAQECSKSVERGINLICIEQKNTKMIFHADYSRLNMVFMILNVITSELDVNLELYATQVVDQLLTQIEESGDTLEGGVKTINEIYQNAQALQAQLHEISQQIQDLEVTKPSLSSTDTLKAEIDAQVLEMESLTIADQLTYYEAEAAEASVLITDVKDDVEQLESDVQEFNAIIDDTKDSLGCGSYDNIFDMNSTEATEALENSEEPECMILYSLQQSFALDELSAFSADLNQISDDVDQLEDDIKIAKEETADMQSRTTQRLALAKDEIVAFEQVQSTINEEVERVESARDGFGTSLNQSSADIEETLTQVASFNESISSVVERIKESASQKAGSIINPIQTEIIPLSGNRTVLDLMFPALLLLVASFTAILLSSITIVRERVSPASFRNSIAPVHDVTILFAHFVTIFLLAAVQMGIFLLTGVFVFGVEVTGNWWLVIFVLSLCLAVFIEMGMVIGYLFRSEETTILTSLGLCMILFIFSSILIPLERMRESLAMVFQFSPFVMAERLLRQLMIFGDVSTIFWFIGILMGYALILWIIISALHIQKT